MSDERLRELERRWREGGAVEDEVAWLRERVRLGVLAPARVRVAAYLGHAASVVAVGEPPALYEPAPEAQLVEWLRGLRGCDGGGGRTSLGVEAELRVALALGRAALPLWVAFVGAGGGEPPADADLFEALLDHAERAVLKDAEARRVVHALALDAWQATHVGSEELGHAAGTVVAGAGNLVVLALGERDPLHTWGLREVELELAQVFGGLEGVREAAAGEVVPWALGSRDPLRERAAARG